MGPLEVAAVAAYVSGLGWLVAVSFGYTRDSISNPGARVFSWHRIWPAAAYSGVALSTLIWATTGRDGGASLPLPQPLFHLAIAAAGSGIGMLSGGVIMASTRRNLRIRRDRNTSVGPSVDSESSDA